MQLQGKEIVVTGATDGIGRIAARELAKAGASVTIVGRNAEKGDRVTREIKAAAGHDRVGFVLADLSSQKSVRAAADALARKLGKIDVLLNNAGAMFSKREVSDDGIERTFALNHLGYFLLTSLLLDKLKATGKARIVNVASRAHEGANLDLANLQNAKSYSGWRAYQQSKLANIYFTYELARRLEGTQVTATCLHPGFVATRFGDNNTGLARTMIGLGKATLALSEEEGAKTSIYLAGSPEVEGITGQYFDKCKPIRSSAVSYDGAVAAALWSASEKLVGLA